MMIVFFKYFGKVQTCQCYLHINITLGLVRKKVVLEANLDNFYTLTCDSSVELPSTGTTELLLEL